MERVVIGEGCDLLPSPLRRSSGRVSLLAEMNVIGSLRRSVTSPFGNKNSTNAEERSEVTVVENQRFNSAAERWSFKYLTSSDPKRFVSEMGETDQFPTIPLPPGYEYSGLWEIDYRYPEEMYSASKMQQDGNINEDDGVGGDNANEDPERRNQWVYSSSFEDLVQGIVLDPTGLGSGSTTPKSSSGTSTPVTSEAPDSVSATLLAALEAEYSLKVETRAVVRQRRYRRTVIRKGDPAGAGASGSNRKAEAAALLSAKGAALVNTTSKVLSSTNKFITDLGDAQKRDLGKLIQGAKAATSRSGGASGMSASTHGMSSHGLSTHGMSTHGGSTHSGEGSTAEEGGAAEQGEGTEGTDNLAPLPAPVPAPAPSATPSPSASRASIGPRVTSFTSRMFSSLKGSGTASASSTPPPGPVVVLSTADATVVEQAQSGVAGIAETAADAQQDGSSGPASRPTSQPGTPVKGGDLPRRNTTDSVREEEGGLSRQNTNMSSLSGGGGGGADDPFPADPAGDNNNFEVEVDMDGVEFNESASEMGDQFLMETASQASGMYYSDSPQAGLNTVGGVANPAGAKRRTSYFGSLFGGGSSSAGEAPAPPPPAPIDPIFKVASPALAAIGRQLRNVEQQSIKTQEAELKSWRTNVKPILEQEIAALEKQVAALMSQIERDAHLGNAHINSLEGLLKDLNEDLDIKKRKYFFPDSPITLGSQGVYVGMNDFWLQSLSGNYVVKLVPKKDAPSDIVVSVQGTTPGTGVTVQCRSEGFRLNGDKGNRVPKLNFDNLKLSVSLTLQVVLSFDPNSKKWLLPAKNFTLRILTFKGPYGINSSMVAMILKLVQPMIRSAIIQVIPHEVGMLLHSLPTNFTLKGEFDVRGMDMSVLSTEFSHSEIFAQLTGYSTQQLEMFVLLQRAMERSSLIRNLSDLIAYRRKYSAHKDLWAQILLVWKEACHVYCDHVITARMEQLIEQASGSINPLQMSVRFDTFLTACDDILHKRTTAKCKVQHIDGQISLNEVIQFAFQVQHRLASDEIAKSTGIKKIRLQNFVESLQSQFALARTLVAVICQNFDFAHLTIVSDLHSGPTGQCTVKITDLLAQAPVQLNLSIMEEKNIGALSLVPYILSFKPQENGDVCLELYSFNHDVAMPDHANNQSVSDKVTSSATFLSYYNLEASDRERREMEQVRLQYEQSMENSSAGQCYSTNYNKLLNAITMNRAAGHSRNHAVSALYPAAALGLDPNNPSAPRAQAGLNSAAARINQHLAVKHTVLQQALNATLSDYPSGDESDTICQILATNPHISVIVDHAVKLAAGTELFTVIVGPKVKAWKPLGLATLVNPDGSVRADDSAEQKRVAALAATSSGRRYSMSSLASSTNNSTSGPLGCPIMVQSAPGIKMFTQVEKADVVLNLPGLIRFLLAHFRDVPLLKEYLEIFVGGVFLVEHLTVVKLVIEKVAKYLLLPGLDLDVNLNIRFVVNAEEIMVRVETPEVLSHVGLNAANLAQASGQAPAPIPTPVAPQSQSPSAAVNLAAEISLKELLDDYNEVLDQLKIFLTQEPATPSQAQQQAPQQQQVGSEGSSTPASTIA